MMSRITAFFLEKGEFGIENMNILHTIFLSLLLLKFESEQIITAPNDAHVLFFQR